MSTYPIYVPSGQNVIPGFSGTNDLGSASHPFNNIYAKNVSINGVAGAYVAVTGDTMSGSLTMASGANILTAISGVDAIGTVALPFSSVWARGGSFILNGGDTVRGGLTFAAGSSIVMDASDSIGTTQVHSVGAGVTIIDTNGAGGTISLTAVNNSVPGISGLKGMITHNAGADDGSTIVHSGNRFTFNGQFDIRNSNSGINNLGTAALPFNQIYVSGVNANAVFQGTYLTTGTYTATLFDTNILVSQQAPIQINIPIGPIGKEYRIISSGISSVNVVTVSGVGVRINNAFTKAISGTSSGASLYVISNGSNYFAMESLT